MYSGCGADAVAIATFNGSVADSFEGVSKTYSRLLKGIRVYDSGRGARIQMAGTLPISTQSLPEIPNRNRL
jgi:hypothetical protein